MKAEGFVASRLRFKEKMAIVAIAISFLVMIVAVAISAGFRREIRGVSGNDYRDLGEILWEG